MKNNSTITVGMEKTGVAYEQATGAVKNTTYTTTLPTAISFEDASEIIFHIAEKYFDNCLESITTHNDLQRYSFTVTGNENVSCSLNVEVSLSEVLEITDDAEKVQCIKEAIANAPDLATAKQQFYEKTKEFFSALNQKNAK